jgi:hypothetical protein
MKAAMIARASTHTAPSASGSASTLSAGYTMLLCVAELSVAVSL